MVFSNVNQYNNPYLNEAKKTSETTKKPTEQTLWKIYEVTKNVYNIALYENYKKWSLP